MENIEKKSANVAARSFLVSIGVIFVLMVVAYILTLVIPAGEYDRTVDSFGNTVIAADSEFHETESDFSFWKWLASPVLVLGASGSGMLIAIIVFLLVIGGAFNALDHCGLMRYMLSFLTHRYGEKRYQLMAVLTLFFMSMGSLIGSFEECVPMIPIVVSLSIALGWDAVTGLAMSLLAAACGFAAGVFNPFSVGVAQKLAGLPMFSGFWLRAVAFVLIYLLLSFFIHLHAKRIERPVQNLEGGYVYDKKMMRALTVFAVLMGIGVATVISSVFITALQDYTLIIVAVMFLVAGVSATLTTGCGIKSLGKWFGEGALQILPAVLMILMASSVKYILEEAKVLDTVLHSSIVVAEQLPPFVIVLFIYLLVLLMNFFVASGSAKAFMIIPLIVPMATVLHIPAQLCVMAYAFGDGFSNAFYPTNPALLLGLNLAGIDYGKWFKWSWKFQLCNLLLTAAVLLFGFAIGYC